MSGIRHQYPSLPRREIRVITLDLDDTLWDVMPVIRRAEAALESWFAEHYPRIPERWPCARRQALRRRIVAANAERAHDLTFLRQCAIAGMAEDSGYPAGISEAAQARHRFGRRLKGASLGLVRLLSIYALVGLLAYFYHCRGCSLVQRLLNTGKIKGQNAIIHNKSMVMV